MCSEMRIQSTFAKTDTFRSESLFRLGQESVLSENTTMQEHAIRTNTMVIAFGFEKSFESCELHRSRPIMVFENSLMTCLILY